MILTVNWPCANIISGNQQACCCTPQKLPKITKAQQTENIGKR